VNDKIRKEFKPKKLNQNFYKPNPAPDVSKMNTNPPSDEDEELVETKRKTREAQDALKKKKEEIEKKVEANKKLM
jgi:hypothetical protein